MINKDVIMSKLQEYTNSEVGKRRMKEYIRARQKSGEPLANGDTIVGEKEMSEAAAALIAIVKKHLPESIVKVGESLYNTPPAERSIGSGEYECFIRFGADALRRESLDRGDGERTGGGIDNIVALFNNGYRASNYVYGWWDEHGPTAQALSRSSGMDSFAWVRSRKEREALHFMQAAVNEFNTVYGAKYGVTATLGGDYQA